MTVTTIYGDTGDGEIKSHAGTYAGARDGTGTLVVNTAASTVQIGQDNLDSGTGDVAVWEIFLAFDTSSIPDTDTISATELALDGSTDNSTTDFTANTYAFDWSGGGLTSVDFRDPADYAGLGDILATWASSGYSASYNAFTEAGAALLSGAINKTGSTYLVLISSRTIGNNSPGGDERVTFVSSNATGTTTDPKLTITHAAAVSFVPRLSLLGVG